MCWDAADRLACGCVEWDKKGVGGLAAVLNSHFNALVAVVREDYATYDRDATRPGFKALLVYRIGAWRLTIRQRFLRVPLTVISNLAYRWIRNHYGIELPATATIGRRFRIVHQGSIVIHRYAQIGDDCRILHGVTIGAIDGAGPGTSPKIGHRVQIGAGAMVLGPVTVGDDANIGANAVVTMDVPAGATAFAAPARIIYPPEPVAATGD